MRKLMYNSPEKVEKIIKKCQVCYIGMVDENNLPYVLPFNFGYNDGVIYLHSAQTGRKIDIIRQKPDVCIAFSTEEQLKVVNEEVACSYSMRFKSVLAFGKVSFIDDYDQKVEALNLVMEQYTGRKDFSYNKPAVDDVLVYKVVVEQFSGKESGY